MKNNRKEQPKIIEDIKEALFDKKIAYIEDVINLTPELDRIFDIRRKITTCIRNKTEIPKIKNLYELVYSTNLMTVSHRKLTKDKKADTRESENDSIEKISYEKLEKLSKELKNKAFKWKNIRQIEIPRSGKNPRPLGLPNYTEKIIQNNILMILEAIYEPIFEELNLNFGFRPHYSCQDAIEEIMHYRNRGLNWAIEGDIKGAFDNIHPPKLANILRKLIDDNDFVQLIYEACIMSTINIKNDPKSIIESSEGSIISPILFNIYMHEFDLDVIELLEQIKIENCPNSKTKSPTTFAYEKNRWKIRKLNKKLEKYELVKKLREITNNEKNEMKKIKITINKIIKIRTRTNRVDYTRILLRYAYNRYADEFLILTNRNEQLCEIIKQRIAEILKTKYYLKLSTEKRIITELIIEHVRYLGFTIFMQKRVVVKRRNTDTLTRPGRQILAGPDLNRIYKRLVEKRMATPNSLRPTSKPSWLVFEIKDIIEKYNSIMLGIYNYYYPIITYKSEISRIYYILYYSCLKTIARKLKTTKSQLFNKFGWKEVNMNGETTNRNRIIYTYYEMNRKKEKIEKYAILINYRDLIDQAKQVQKKREIWRKIKETYRKQKDKKTYSLSELMAYQSILQHKIRAKYEIPIPDLVYFEDIWTKYKMNWRTTFKLIKFCNICGSNEKLETHHIKKAKEPDINKNDRFAQTQTIMKNLNRKQLLVCRECYNRIHSGKYNGMLLKDSYDNRTMQIENNLKAMTAHFYSKKSQIDQPLIFTLGYQLKPELRIIINNRPSSQIIGKPRKGIK